VNPRRGRLEDLALLSVSVAGLAAFLAPILLGAVVPQATALFSGLIAASALTVLAIGLQTHRLSTRLLAVLAALVAIDATLRLVVVIGLLGFSPIFFLIIVGGYVFGPGFGFAQGALTLLLSAVITAGFGPWLPYQMLASGWVGMGAGYLGKVRRLRRQTVMLAIYGCLAGWGYGILLDLWEWPFLLQGASSPISWASGLSSTELWHRFLAFYLASSFLYDSFRAAGNLLLVLTLGAPLIVALARFRQRFLVQWIESTAERRAPANIAADVGTPA
jgi:energy-coupling factor transport system substrate-specific component